MNSPELWITPVTVMSQWLSSIISHNAPWSGHYHSYIRNERYSSRMLKGWGFSFKATPPVNIHAYTHICEYTGYTHNVCVYVLAIWALTAQNDVWADT